MSLLDTIYEINKERIRKGKRVISLATPYGGTVLAPLGEINNKKREDKKANDKPYRQRTKR